MQRFKVDGMTCGHCERAVTEAILTDSQADPQRLAAAVQAEGYDARPL